MQRKKNMFNVRSILGLGELFFVVVLFFNNKNKIAGTIFHAYSHNIDMVYQNLIENFIVRTCNETKETYIYRKKTD